MEIYSTPLFINDRTTDQAYQSTLKPDIQKEILKRLGGWHPMEVSTLFKLSLSHVISLLPSQKEEPLCATFDCFEKCFSNVPLINYLASKDLLNPFLKRLPVEHPLSSLKLNHVCISPETFYNFLRVFGKDLSCLRYHSSSLPIRIDELALFVPGLEDIEIDNPFSLEELHQLIESYPKIKRIGPNALRNIDAETLRELMQRCTELREFSHYFGYYGQYEHEDFTGITALALRKLGDLNGVGVDAIGLVAFAARCTNLTSIEIRERMDIQYPLIDLLMQCTNLTELSLPRAFCDSNPEKSIEDNPVDLTFPNIRKITGNAALVQKYFHAVFPNAQVSLHIDTDGEEFLEKFSARHRNIKSIHYWPYSEPVFKRENFRKLLAVAGSALKSIDLGVTARVTDEDVDTIVLNCPNLEKFRCWTKVLGNKLPHQLTSQPLISLFKAAQLKKVHIACSSCGDRAIKKLLKKSGSSLTHLKIEYCPITDKSLRIIAKHGRGLKSLSLWCTTISGGALAELVYRLPNLKRCNLGTRLLKEHVALISQRLPNLEKIGLGVDQSQEEFPVQECYSYFPRYIVVEFTAVSADGKEEIVLSPTNSPDDRASLEEMTDLSGIGDQVDSYLDQFISEYYSNYP
jgi:hypothetical protein